MLPNTATTTLQNILAEMDEECKKQAKEKAQENPCHSLSPEKNSIAKMPSFLKKQNPMKKLEKAFIYLTRLTMLSLSIFKGLKKRLLTTQLVQKKLGLAIYYYRNF